MEYMLFRQISTMDIRFMAANVLLLFIHYIVAKSTEKAYFNMKVFTVKTLAHLTLCVWSEAYK